MNVPLAEQSPWASPRRCSRNMRASSGRTMPETIVLGSNLSRLLHAAVSTHDKPRFIHLRAVAMRGHGVSASLLQRAYPTLMAVLSAICRAGERPRIGSAAVGS